MKYCSIRMTNIYAFVITILLLIASYYFQYVMLLEPCPLCIIQRLLVMLLAVSFFWGIFLRRGLRVQNMAVLIFAVLGVLAASRKVWLQHTATTDMVSCAPSLDYLLQQLHLREIIHLLSGADSCSQIDWQFLGLSMSAWMLAFFILFSGLALYNFSRANIITSSH